MLKQVYVVPGGTMKLLFGK